MYWFITINKKKKRKGKPEDHNVKAQALISNMNTTTNLFSQFSA